MKLTVTTETTLNAPDGYLLVCESPVGTLYTRRNPGNYLPGGTVLVALIYGDSAVQVIPDGLLGVPEFDLTSEEAVFVCSFRCNFQWFCHDSDQHGTWYRGKAGWVPENSGWDVDGEDCRHNEDLARKAWLEAAKYGDLPGGVWCWAVAAAMAPHLLTCTDR